METSYNKIYLVFFIVFLLLFTSFLPLGYASSEVILKFRIRNPRISYITHTITIRNKGNFPVRNVKLWVPIIKNETPHYLVLIDNITADSPYRELESDSSNNTYIFWEIDTILPKESFTVKIEYSALSFNVQYMVNAALVGDYLIESELYRKYTQPEEYIESDDPLITEAAKTLASNETNPQVLALKIANFVSKNLFYEIQNEERGAKWALINKVGDCSEFAYLFAALCRACRIPARVKAGFAFHSGDEKATAGHMWAEYYLPNYGWVPVDLVWKHVDYQDNLHFSSLQSFPMKYPYDNFFVEYSAVFRPSIEAYETIEIKEASIDDLENFSLARLAYDVAYKIETAESLYLLSILMGAKIFSPADFAKLEKAINDFDILMQQSLEDKDIEGIQQANLQIEYVLGLAEGILFKCGLMLTLIILIILLVIIGINSRKRRVNDSSTL